MICFRIALLTILLSACSMQAASGPDSNSTSPGGGITNAGHTNESEAVRFARVWIDYWNGGNPHALPLAEAFVHVSPFGRLEGRKHYLDTVIPMSERNVSKLSVNRVIGHGNQAVIWFDMHTPTGKIAVCDWVIVENSEIVEIHSFYDASSLRYNAMDQ